MSARSPDRTSVLRDVRGELSARVTLLKRQEQEVGRLRMHKEREMRRIASLDASRQRTIHETVAAAKAAFPAVSASGHSYATPGAAVAASGGSPGRIGSPGSAARTPRGGINPLERSHAAVELAQAVTAQRRNQLAASAAVTATHRASADRYREAQDAGEARVAVAHRDLELAQAELRQTTEALDNAQTVLAERSARLNEARGKLATLMSMTRDLLRLVKPVTDLRATVKRAGEPGASGGGARASGAGASPKRVAWTPSTPERGGHGTPGSATRASIADVEARFQDFSASLDV